jgi:hypothetical protein
MCKIRKAIFVFYWCLLTFNAWSQDFQCDTANSDFANSEYSKFTSEFDQTIRVSSGWSIGFDSTFLNFQLVFTTETNGHVGSHRSLLLIRQLKNGEWQGNQFIRKGRYSSYYKKQIFEYSTTEEITKMSGNDVKTLWLNLIEKGILAVNNPKTEKQVGGLLVYTGASHDTYCRISLQKMDCTKSVGYASTFLRTEGYDYPDNFSKLKSCDQILKELIPED